MDGNIEIIERERVDSFTSYMVFTDNWAIHAQISGCPEIVNTWIEMVQGLRRRRPLVVGISARYADDNNSLAVIQLCVGKCCLLFQVCCCREVFPQKLREFLLDQQIIFVGVGVEDIKHRLESDYQIQVAKIVELNSLAAEQRQNEMLRENSIEDLSRTLLRYDIMKPEEVLRCRWNRKKLKSRAIKFAVIDAFVSHRIGKVLDPMLQLRNLSLEVVTQDEVEAMRRINRFWRYRVFFYSEVMHVAIDDGVNHNKIDAWITAIFKLYCRKRDRLIFGIHIQGQNDIFQICVGHNCIFIQLSQWRNRRFPRKLIELLTDERYRFVGFNSQSILEWLQWDHGIRVGGRVYDVRALVAEGNRDNSLLNLELGALYWNLVQQTILKPRIVEESNWGSLQLNEDQIMYGSLDPYACYSIGSIFLNV